VITVVLFAACAAIGALARAEAGHRLNRPGGMPYGILVVNITGSFLLGLLSNVTPPTLTIVGVGGLGAYTTFSSFAHDVVVLAERRQLVATVGYVLASCTGAVAAAALGVWIVS
jgi:fluoride exporter